MSKTAALSWQPDKSRLLPPFYKTLANLLEEAVRTGELPLGTKLPPQRELADYLQINFTTVTRAYNICKEKGLIQGTVGKGTFVALHATDSLTITKSNLPHGCIEMGLITSFEQCNELVSKVIQNVASQQYAEQLLDYNYPAGMPHQLQAACTWLSSLGISCQPDSVAITSGSQNALVITLAALFEPGDKIAVDFYTYSSFIELAKTFHIQLLPVSGDNEGMLAFELEQLCRQTKVNGLYIMPSMNNPTTIQTSISRKYELAAVIKRHNLIVIEDDIAAFIFRASAKYRPMPLFSLLPEQTVYICAMTKPLCSGLRIAYIAFGNKFRNEILNTIYTFNVKTSSFDAEIITQLITTGTADIIVSRKKSFAKKANAIFNSFFPLTPAPPTQSTFFRWLPINSVKTAADIENDLKQRGVRIYTSQRFLVGLTEQQKYLRLALPSPGSHQKLKTGLLHIREYLNEQQT